MLARQRSLVWLSMPLVAALAMSACVERVEYDQRGGPAIADAIEAAGSPIVETVNYHLGDLIDAATISITIRHGSTAAEITSLLCNVVAEAVQNGDPPDSLGVEVWDEDVTQILASDLDPCPS
jgi:hypothetical protein